MNPLDRFWPRRGRRPDPAPPRLDEAAKERLVMTALEGIAAGWTAAQLQAHLGPSRDDRAFEGWLANFAYRRWFSNPVAHGEVAQGLMRWGELDNGELGKAAGAIGRELQHCAVAPTPAPAPTPLADPATQVSESSSQSAPPRASTPAEGDESAGKALLQQAMKAYQRGDVPAALAAAVKATQVVPDSHQAWSLQGGFLGMLGQYGEAIAAYDAALAIKPDRHEALFNKGLTLANLGRYEEAIAAYDAALAIKPDKHEALTNKGIALGKLGRYEEAISAYDAALALKPDDHRVLFNKGMVLHNLGRYEEAITTYDAALAIKPDFHEALTNKGAVLCNFFGCYEEAISACDAALNLKPDDPTALYNNRGVALGNLERYEEAIAAYDAALAIKPDDHEALFNKGNALFNLERYEEAIAAYDAALAIKPDDHAALFKKGYALGNLERYEEAIAAYDAALAIKPDDDQALLNKGIVLCDFLGRYEAAIAAFDAALSLKPDYANAWFNRGVAAGKSWQCSTSMRLTLPPALQDVALDDRRYAGEIACYQAGLRQVTATADPLGWGQLHWQMGRAHFRQHRFTEQAHRYARLALSEYDQALTTLTAYPEEHLKVLQDSIRAHLLLGQHPQARQQREEGLALLQDLINRHPQRRRQLEQKFSGLSRIEVDLLLQDGSPIAALETAERYKNRALTWLLDALGETTLSPSLGQITTLLHPGTALVMWHLSPDHLTRFVLLPGLPDPIATSQPTQGLETWLKAWDRDYGDYRSKGKTSGDPSRRQHPWRQELSPRLERLTDILDIPSLSATLAEAHITHLILIPHGDLHRLPLHTLFCDSYTSHTLPSAQLGLTLQARLPQPQNPSLLSIEDPTSALDQALSNAALESALIRHLCRAQQRPITTLAHAAATRPAVLAALQQPHGILHYTGHGLHNPRQPRQSALALAAGAADSPDQLTAADLAPLPLASYGLTTLAACETAITGQQDLTADYVGLPSSLMQAGVAQVVSTLWVVEEAAAAWLMVNFYQRWLGGAPAATALHQAQQWLRRQTHGQLAAWLRELAALPDLDPQLGDNLRAKAQGLARSGDTIQPEVCPYGDPYYWAAFVLTGSRGCDHLAV